MFLKFPPKYNDYLEIAFYAVVLLLLVVRFQALIVAYWSHLLGSVGLVAASVRGPGNNIPRGAGLFEC